MKKLGVDVHSTGFATSMAFVLLVVVYFFCTTSAAKNGFYEKGMEEYNAGNYRGAAADFRIDVGYHPEHSLGHYYLACSLLKSNQRSEAGSEFDKAYQMELRSDNVDTTFAAKCHLQAKELTASSPKK